MSLLPVRFVGVQRLGSEIRTEMSTSPPALSLIHILSPLDRDQPHNRYDWRDKHVHPRVTHKKAVSTCLVEEGDGFSLASCAPRTTDSVDVVVDVLGHIVVDDHGHGRDIESTRSHIGCNLGHNHIVFFFGRTRIPCRAWNETTAYRQIPQRQIPPQKTFPEEEAQEFRPPLYQTTDCYTKIGLAPVRNAFRASSRSACDRFP